MKLKVIKIVVVLLVLAVCLVMVKNLEQNYLQAQNTSTPGSPTDPLVSKSYVDGKVEDLMKEINQLKNEIALIKTQNKAILEEIASVKKQLGTSTGTGSTTQQKGVVTAQTLNVRKGPGTNYDRITVISLGTEFTILKKEGDWYNIRLKDGKEGWVHSGFIKILP